MLCTIIMYRACIGDTTLLHLTRFLVRWSVKERPTPLLEPVPEYSSGSLKETDPLLSQGKVEVQADIDPLSKPSAKIPLKTALP